jgi:uncharacterized protein
MTKEWKTSCFTAMIDGARGELLLHNSFMGAVARIPQDEAERLRPLLRPGKTIADSDDPAIQELSQQGFLVRADIDERAAVTQILEKERSTVLPLMVLPHEDCNFRCVYCYEQFTKKSKMRRPIIDGLKAFVAREIGKYKGLSVTWFGGEPLLARDVIDELSCAFIDICDRHGASYSAGISTNGYLLNSKTQELLIGHKVRAFQICIDGPENLHDAKRKRAAGGKTYSKIMDNLLAMRSRNEQFSVSLRVNFDNASVPFIDDWLSDEIGPRFAGDPRFSMYFEPVTKRGGPNDGDLDVCAPEQANALSARFFARAMALGFSDRNVKRFLQPHGMVCYAAKEPGVIVGYDGKVYKCSLVFDDPDNVVGSLTADGDLHLDSAKAAMWTTLQGRDTSACDACAFYASCQGRKCPLVTIKQNKPACPFNREMYETMVKLVASGDAAPRCHCAG